MRAVMKGHPSMIRKLLLWWMLALAVVAGEPAAAADGPAGKLGLLKAQQAQAGVATVQSAIPPVAKFARYRKAMANLRAGLSDARILFAGDSTQWGFPGGPQQSSAAYLVARYKAIGVPAAVGLAVPPSTQNGNINADPRWTVGSGWSLDLNGWAFNSCFKASTGAGPLVYAPGAPSDTADAFDVYYITTGVTASFTIQATGGSLVTVAPTSTQIGVYKATALAASATTTNTLTITPANGTRIIGVEARNSTVKRLLIGNAGVSSSSTAQWANTTNPYLSANAIAAYAPDLTVFEQGLNDAAIPTPVLPSVLQANMQTVIGYTLPVSDMILETPIPPTLPNAIAPVALYIPVFYSLYNSNPVGIIDIYSRWGFANTANLNALGYYRQANDLHPSQVVGYGDVAAALFDYLRPIASNTLRLPANDNGSILRQMVG